MSTKKLLLRPVAERFFVSISSPLFVDGSRLLERFFSGLLFRSLGSFSSSDNVRRLLKLGKRFNSVATMVLSEALGLSLFLVLRGGIACRTVTRCRSTQGRTTYLILPSNRASQEPNRPPPRRMERALYQRRSSCLPMYFFGVEEHSFLPNRQEDRGNLPCQGETRHRRPSPFGQKPSAELLERSRPSAGGYRRTLEDIFHIVIVVLVQA